MRPRVGIGIFIFRDGKFLMGRRKGSHGEDDWSLPGGHLEFGESPEQTAAREVREETGIEIKNIRFGALTNDVFVDDNKHYVSIWMIGEWAAGEPVITEPDKYVDQQWFDFNSLPQPLFLPWRQLLDGPFFDDLKRQLELTKVKRTSGTRQSV